MNDQNCIQGFNFTSDRLKSQCLWLVGLSDLADLLLRTGKDYPSQGAWIRTPSGDLKTWAGDHEPPVGWFEAAKKKPKK